MKQTAVEWLQDQLKKGVDFNPLDQNSYSDNVEKLFQQAKQMEKEQTIDAWEKGNHTEMRGGKFLRPAAEQYYNETFKSE